MNNTTKVLVLIATVVCGLIYVGDDGCSRDIRTLEKAMKTLSANVLGTQQVKEEGGGMESGMDPVERDAKLRMSKDDPKAAFEASMKRKWQARAGLYKDKKKYPQFEKVVMVTMVNHAYGEMFENWKCFANKQGLDYLVLAFDKKAMEFMGPDRSVLLEGAETEEQIRVGTNRFNVMGCQKVDAVIALLELNADVVIIDADCVFKKDPIDFFNEALSYDLYFQANHPECQGVDVAKLDPACFLINSGLYYVSSRNTETLELFKDARRRCYASTNAKNKSPTDGAGDQRAIQRMLNDELNIPTHFYGLWDSKLKTLPRKWSPAYNLEATSKYRSARYCKSNPKKTLNAPTFEYCTMDPTIYPAGKSKTDRANMVLFHANHLPGGIAKKIQQLAKHDLWNPKCHA